jgi:hypothetical protein
MSTAIPGGEALASIPAKENPQSANKKPRYVRNAVHLSGAAFRFTGNRVFEIFTVLGLEGLGR